tara:strand:+ start:521 stop:790 length:270 start_codon:yes stop_codon:yes gene_type:complete
MSIRRRIILTLDNCFPNHPMQDSFPDYPTILKAKLKSNGLNPNPRVSQIRNRLTKVTWKSFINFNLSMDKDHQTIKVRRCSYLIFQPDE